MRLISSGLLPVFFMWWWTKYASSSGLVHFNRSFDTSSSSKFYSGLLFASIIVRPSTLTTTSQQSLGLCSNALVYSTNLPNKRKLTQTNHPLVLSVMQHGTKEWTQSQMVPFGQDYVTLSSAVCLQMRHSGLHTIPIYQVQKGCV